MTMASVHVTREAEGPRTLRSRVLMFALTEAVISAAFAGDVPPVTSVGMLRDTETPYAECSM